MVSHRRELEFELAQYTLGNGLTVVLHHDDSLPIVAVNLWYHVGSKDEDPTRTGLAHLFEHLMFEGSANYNDEYFKPLQEAGGSINGSTSHDRTRYYDVVPSNFLELALWMEADRMANLLPVLNLAKLNNQRSVVKNERRQRVDNQPYGKVSETLAGLLFPSDHPYSWPVIGSMEHLDAATLEDASEFFRHFYRPSNVALVVAGQFDNDNARRWIDQYFGPIANGSSRPSQPPVTPQSHPQPTLIGESRRQLEDAVALPRFDMVWLTGPHLSADEPALDFAAQILGGRSKGSRLKRRLIHDAKLVNTIGTYHGTQKLAGQFGVGCYALPNTPLSEVEKAVVEEIERLRREPPTEAEIQQARNAFLNQAIARVETVLGRADSFNQYLFHQRRVTPQSFVEELERYDRVTAEDVRRVAEQYLGPNRAVIEVRPQPDGTVLPAAPEPDRNAEKITAKEHWSGVLPGPTETPTFRLPVTQRAVAANGLRISLVEWPKLPRVDFLLALDAGACLDPANKLGLARLVGDTLDEGTTSRDGLEIARQLDVLGSSLSASSGIESSTVSLRTLRENLDKSFELFADVIQNPSFTDADLDRERDRLLAELAHRHKQPSALADDAIDAAIYGPEHPYGRPCDGSEVELRSIGREDMVAFHRDFFHPKTASLLVVGQITMDEVLELVARRLGNWGADRAAANASAAIPFSPPLESLQIIERPNAAQSVIRLGKLSIARKSPDYFPLMILNTVVGGQFTSRLNLNLREEKGYTYGARSGFLLRRHGGAFGAGADIQSSATQDALNEFLREITGPANDRPITEEELHYAKAYLTRRFPSRFETSGGIIAHLAQLAIYDLPDDYYDRYLPSIEAVTLDDISCAASDHLTADGMKVVIVGNPTHVRGITLDLS